MSAGAAWQRVLLLPWQQGRNRGSMRFWYLLAIAVLCSVVGSLVALPRPAGGMVAALLLAMLALGGWLRLVQDVLLQNQTLTARLVPGHARTLRRVLMGAGLLLTAVSGLVGAVFGHPWLALAGAAAALLAVAWSVRIPRLAPVLWLAPLLLSGRPAWPALAALEETVGELARAHPGLTALATAAALCLSTTLTLRSLLQSGDARQRGCDAARALPGGLLQVTGVHSALNRVPAAAYRRALARLSARPGGDVLGRSLIGLGAAFHWRGQMGLVLVYGVMLGLLWALLLLFTPWGWPSAAEPAGLGPALWLVPGVLMLFVVANSLALVKELHLTRREQALLMLLPGMPRGAVLNRQLARQLIARFLASWAVGLLVCAVLLPLRSNAFAGVVTVAAAWLPLCALLGSDLSRGPGPTRLHAGPWFVLMTVIGANAAALRQGWGLAAWSFLAGFAALTLAQLAWRWRALRHAPSAFPVSRRA